MWPSVGLALLSPMQIARFFHARRLGRRLGLQGYQVNHLHTADALLSLAGKRVLEVGGSLPSRMVNGLYRCASWTCVDNRIEYDAALDFQHIPPADGAASSGQHRACDWTFRDGRFEQVAPDLAGPFDVIFSSAVLEHVEELPACLVQMRRLIASGGAMFHAVGPIWSGPSGYHVYPSYFRKHGPTAGRQVVAALSPWIHLLKTSDQMLAYLTEIVGLPLAQEAVESIYHSPRLTRRVFNDYIAAFDDAGLRVAWLHKWRKPLRDSDAWRSLRATGVDHANYRFDTFWTVLVPK